MKTPLITLLLLCVLSSFISCSDYDGETKYIYEGRILDATGYPLRDIPVSVQIKKTDDIWVFPFSYNETDIISYSTTDEYGYFKMVYPKPNENAARELFINYNNPSGAANTNLSSIVVYNLLEQNNSDYKLSFNDHKLYETNTSIPLTLQFNSQSENYLVKLNLIGLVKENYIDYNLDLPHVNTNQWMDTFNNIIMVAPNQMLTIEYQLQDESGNITIQQTQVQINSQPLTYQLTY